MADAILTQEEIDELLGRSPAESTEGVFQEEELAGILGQSPEAGTESPLTVEEESSGLEAFLGGLVDSPIQNVARGTANVVAEGIRRGDAALSGREREPVSFGNAFTGEEGSLFPGPSQFDIAPGTEGFAQTGRAASGGVEILLSLLGGGASLLARGSTEGGEFGLARLSENQIERELASRISNRNVLTARNMQVLQQNPQMADRFKTSTFNTAKRAGAFFDNLPDTMLLRLMQNPRGSAIEEASAIAAGVGTGALFTTLDREATEELDSTALSGDVGTIVGSIFSPATFFTNRLRVSIPKAVQTVGNMFGKGPKSQVQAALVIREMAESVGKNPEDFLRQLDDALATAEAAGIKGAENLPPDILLGDNFLGTLRENFGADLPARVSKNLREAGEKDIDQFTGGLLKLAQRLRSAGDPELAEAAVVAERQAALSMMQDRELEALGRLNRTFIEIFPDDVALGDDAVETAAALTQRRAQAGIKVHEILEDALSEANRVDGLLWENFGAGITVKPQGLQPIATALEGVVEELGSTGRLPRVADINKFLDEGATVKQLVRLRSDFLTQARKLRSDQDFPAARDVSALADGVDEILLSIGGDQLGLMRQFTRQKRDLFTRSFGGRALASDRQGADKMRPQDILEMATRFRSQDRLTVEFSELSEAGFFGDLAAGISGGRGAALDTLRAENRFNQATGGSISRQEFIESILGFDTPMGTDVLKEGRTFMRAAMSGFVDDDGNFDARQFSRFIRNNASTINDMGGGLKEMVQDVNLARRLYEDTVATNKTQTKSMLQRRVFAEITGADGNPTMRIKPLMANGFKPEDFKSFMDAAQKAEEAGMAGAVDGFKATILKAAEEMAETSGNGLSWHRFDSILNGSTRTRPSVVQQMTDGGLIDEAAADRLQTMIDVGKKTELNFSDPELALALGFGRKEPGSMFENLAAGALGSVAATAAARRLGLLSVGGAGPSLVIAQGGASISRAFLNQALDDSTHTALMRGLNSADEFKTMMEAVNPENFRRIYNKINSMAVAAGIDNLGDFDSTIQEVERELEESMQMLEVGDDDDLPEIPDLPPQPANNLGTVQEEPDFFDQF